MADALPLRGAGLGLRRALLDELIEAPVGAFDFLECAPDNWIGVGGVLGEKLQALSSRHPLSCHGLALSLGAIALYSEHLSYCSAGGHLYDLLPLPFTDEAVHHVAARIAQVQDVLGRRIAIENVSYYAAPYQALGEIDFIDAVLREADCDLLLDVNNVFVNAVNHGYDARAFIDAMPGERIASLHVAGHYDEADDLKVDTHGTAVKADVWDLLAHAYRAHGLRPTLLERDFNFPPLGTLLDEVQRIRDLQAQAA